MKEIGMSMNDVGRSGRIEPAWVYKTSHTMEIIVQRVRFYSLVARVRWFLSGRKRG